MSINYIRYIEPEALIHEHLSDNEITAKNREDVLYRWVDRATAMISRVECQVFRLAIIDIKNYTGKLPAHLESVYLAGSFEAGTGRVGREEMRKWVYDKLGTDCEVEVSLNCPQCSRESCTCGEPLIEIEIDDLYREERPYMTHVNYWPFVGYSAPITDGFSCMDIAPKFSIMRPKVSDSVWWNTGYYLGACMDLGDNWRAYHSFHLEDGKIITTMKEGQVLMSYLANKRTKDGYRMVPDNVFAIEAILAYLDYMEAKKAARLGN
jgi:hypothetical protein